jgi:pimeloyl-ACP methyl ester carboxylesterase
VTVTVYEVRRTPRHETLRVRGLDIHLTRWGPPPSPSTPLVFLLHGWQDTGDTFQFMVDALGPDWALAAPDWRGFGRSAWPVDGYWFPDYFADLEALLAVLSPDEPARIVGHSMGGNIANQYAGIRPARVRCLANLEGFGLPRTSAGDAPGRLRRWLDQVKSAPLPRNYESVGQLAGIIRHRYPRLTAAQSDFVARAWSEPTSGAPDGGRVRLVGDPRHRWVNPVRYAREDAEACWREVEAPVLLVVGDESEYLPGLGTDGADDAFRRFIPHLEVAHIPGAGHMLHIEQPERVAALVENFLNAH